jgi:UPF0755 protein
MSKKKTIKIAIILTALILIPALLFVVFKAQYESALKEPNSSSTETVEFEIIEGESIDSIIPSLIAQDLLKEKHKNYLLIYLKTNNLIPTIQAGSFNIPKNLNMKELAETLQTAGVPSNWITIPEGLRADEIAQKVSAVFTNTNEDEFMSLVQDQAFINSLELHGENITSLEGFLFPDKYLMQKEIEAQEVILIMVENFKNKVPNDYNYEDIILASLIEREGINSEDRRIISGILQKRLDEQWLLQVDASLLYHKKDWDHTITVQDKDETQPYNTYMYHGLPPTPICNPGLDSIQSVFEPESTEYYYYIHYKDEDGNLVPGYSETLGEHETKIQKYLR